MNLKEFTLKDITNVNHEQTGNFILEINQASYIYIKNCLIETLKLLNTEETVKKIYSLENKYSLYKNALIQLEELSLYEEEKELIKVITSGLSNIISCFQKKIDEMN